MKRLVFALLMLVVFISLVACSENKEVKWYSHEQMQEMCNPIIDSIINSVNNKDESTLKEHYSESALANDKDFSGGFNRLCNYLSENIESYTYKNGQTENNKEDDKSETDILAYYTISLSDGSEYEIALSVRVVDEIGDTDSELGLTYMVITTDDSYVISQPSSNSCIIMDSEENKSVD